MANAIFSVASIDPDTNKQNFIAWLSSQPQYSGYNFSGANFNVILDVLSRNTSLEAFYVNMGLNETFGDSAQLRDSVVSRAKEFGYCPSSMGSSSTSLNISITTNGLQSFNIPFGTRFGGVNSNGSYTFITDDNYFQTSTTGNYNFSNVIVYEGNYLSEIFSINNSITNQIFTLSNPTIDTSSLKVLVSEDGGVTQNQFQLANNIFDLNGNSDIFYVQAGSNNTYEIYFGDGILGHQPINGSVVQVYYRSCSGQKGDNVSKFSLLDNLGAYNGGTVTSISVTPLNTSFGGTAAETIDSIRFNFPINFQTQGKASTAADYQSLIKKKFPQVGDVIAYSGGITSTSVLYGTVILSCVTPSGNPLTQTLKDEIISYCSNLDLIHPSTQIVDATNLLINISTNVHVDFSVTNNSINYYKQTIGNTINSFSATNLQKYNKVLRYSKLCDAIDYVDNNAIISDETTLTLKRNIPITINTNTNIITSFNNPITNLSSDRFISNGVSTYITDSLKNTVANGTLYNVFFNSNNNIINYYQVGKVDYNSGDVNISNLNINQFLSNSTIFYLYGTPANKDIYSANSDIIKIDPMSITINVSN